MPFPFCIRSRRASAEHLRAFKQRTRKALCDIKRGPRLIRQQRLAGAQKQQRACPSRRAAINVKLAEASVVKGMRNGRGLRRHYSTRLVIREWHSKLLFAQRGFVDRVQTSLLISLNSAFVSNLERESKNEQRRGAGYGKPKKCFAIAVRNTLHHFASYAMNLHFQALKLWE